MQLLVLILILFCCCTSSTVVTLDDSNFESIVESSSTDDWFINFYSPSCGSCQQLEPIWEEIGLVLQKEEEQEGGRQGPRLVKVGRVDVTQNRGLADRFMIKSFPTLRLFTSGKRMYTYNGDKTVEDIVAYARVLERGLHGSTETPSTLFFHEKFAVVVTTILFWVQGRAAEAITAFEEGRYSAPSLLGFLFPTALVLILFLAKLLFGRRGKHSMKRTKQY